MSAVLEFIEDSHTYLVDGKPRVSTTDLLKRNGLYKSPQFATDEHLWRGKAIHEALNYYHKGTLDWSKLDSAILPYIHGWEKFQRETGFKAIGWEEHLWHPIFHYGGTPDVWGEVANEIWVPDYKSGPVERVTGLQLASYVELLRANNKIPLDKPVRRMGVQLKPTGEYNPRPFNDPMDFNIWSMIVSVHNWGENNV